ncbi:fructose PTS transporter subunit IIA [Carnobacterium maltaromaticum]|uniref:Fructose PTS transporter subunit IIA n=1 Tax=Carnobacterium maltaromaticum TaxID=2751 RepID=A0AAW9JLT3_CARML|nr:fructose PTS transporter subunit IIA [Carnobacterium maltaromaticum]MDZ5757357.1 fructose PTS transporter subunit IIA [Carnobacterium maltaromaticum]
MNLLREELIDLESRATTQNEAFREIAKIAVKNGYGTDEKAIIASLVERESEGTTGMMDGFSIPHAKCSEISHPAIIILRMKNELEWNSLDGKPIKVIVSLLIPTEEAGTTHLKILAKVAKLLMNSEVKEGLKTTTNKLALIDLISRKIEM